MSSGGDGDRHRQNLGVSQIKQAKKKKSRRPIDPEDIAGSISSVPERIYSFICFSIWYAICRARPLSAGIPSPTGIAPQLSVMRLGDSSSEQSDAVAGTPALTQCFVHSDVPPSSTATPSATPHDTMSTLAPGQKDRLNIGVPLITWPLFSNNLYTNKLLETVGLAIGIGADVWNSGFILSSPPLSGEKIELAVKRLMNNSEESRKIRENAKLMAKKLKSATEEGGSSHSQLIGLIEEIKRCAFKKSS
ncbi:hypothetical protein RDI58_018125 [Solanum bulbocastanum]|uniref:Uncharacterized protein n=1 Tax=Solanum bulbocastanum TaxID=147425 RepID=A0AAN8TBB1_SOLBU